MPALRRCLTFSAIGLLTATGLTACGDEAPVTTAPTGTTSSTSATTSTSAGSTETPAPSSTGTPAAPTSSSTSSTSSSPVDNPIKGSSVKLSDLAPAVNAAQREAQTFHLKMDDRGTLTGEVRCAPAVAWKITEPDGGDEIHVDGKQYSRSKASNTYRVREDDDSGPDDDHPCNFASIVPSSAQDDLTFTVVSRDAKVNGQSGLIHLRGSTTSTSTASKPRELQVWLTPEMRPVRVSLKRGSSGSTLDYLKFGEPVSIVAPANATSSSPSTYSASPSA